MSELRTLKIKQIWPKFSNTYIPLLCFDRPYLFESETRSFCHRFPWDESYSGRTFLTDEFSYDTMYILLYCK